MTQRDKSTQTVHIPGSDSSSNRKAADLDGISTQILSDTSNVQVGLLTVVDGAGRGETRSVFSGTNQIGRVAENRIPLDFGDDTISRLQHAVVVYDSVRRVFSIHNGGKKNPIFVNGEKLTSERSIQSGDIIMIGMTKLKFSVL